MSKIDVTRFVDAGRTAMLMKALWLAGSPCSANAGAAYDRQASRALGLADYDFGKVASSVLWGERALFWCRQKALDGAVARFAANHPGGAVVNLCCGLSTAEFRGDHGSCQWIDVDEAGVLALRRELFPPLERHAFLAHSFLDLWWMDELPCPKGIPILFVADGVLSRMTSGLAKALVVLLAERFPGAKLCFDAASVQLGMAQALVSGQRASAEARRMFCAEQTEALQSLSSRIAGVSSRPLAPSPRCSYSFGEKVCMALVRRLGLMKCIDVDFKCNEQST